MRDSFGNWNPRAVVFDCDGLLMNTEPCWLEAEREVFARRGLDFGPAQQAEFIGRAMSVNAAVMAELFGEPGNAPAIEAEVHATVLEVITAQAEPMAGARELVAQVAAKVPVAVATNSPRALLEVTLRRGGFDDVFAVSVAVDEVSQPKPHPAIYATTCDRLGLPPASVLALEDSLTGLAAAQAAGMRVIGVPTLDEGEFPADHVLPALSDSALALWVDGWPPA